MPSRWRETARPRRCARSPQRLPFLVKASAVWLITQGAADSGGSLFALEYFAWHGINAQHRDLSERAGPHVGRLLLEATRDCGADLMVMGGYGHSPGRERVLGGTTRDVIGAMTMPILLVH